MFKVRRWPAVIALFAPIALVSPAIAQPAYPAHPITLIVAEGG